MSQMSPTTVQVQAGDVFYIENPREKFTHARIFGILLENMLLLSNGENLPLVIKFHSLDLKMLVFSIQKVTFLFVHQVQHNRFIDKCNSPAFEFVEGIHENHLGSDVFEQKRKKKKKNSFTSVPSNHQRHSNT